MTAPTGGWGTSCSQAGAFDLADGWASARARVVAVLRARGVQGADVEDIVQEVAIRALRDRDRFQSADHLVRWCCRVAVNLHVDAVRHARWLRAELPSDVPGAADTAEAAERRVALGVLAAEIAGLSAEDRQLLLEPSPAGSRREAVRRAVRRHRLRARLAALVDGLAAAVGLVRRFPRRTSAPPAAGLVAVPIVAVGLLLGPLHPYLGPASRGPGPGASANPVVWTPVPAAPAGRSASGAPDSPAHGATASGGLPTAAAPARHPQTDSTTVLQVRAAGAPVDVSHDRRPGRHPTVCLFGALHVCVARPGPPLPPPGAGLGP